MKVVKAAALAVALTFGTATVLPLMTTEAVAAKRVVKKKAKSVKKMKRAKKATCGVYKYRKGGRCLDARNKR